MGRFARAFIEILRLTFRREHLDRAPPRPRATRRSALRMLFAPESLAMDPPAVKRPQHGVARMLFAPEALSSEPPPATSRRRTRWMRWLFGREPLDLS